MRLSWPYVTTAAIVLALPVTVAQTPSVVAVINGGTGASDAATARANLGAAAEGSGGVPSGAIMFIKTGSCPTGWTQETAFLGLYILATTAAAGDVGTTGGSTSYTPAGTSAAPTVNSLTAAAQVFTGSAGTVPAQTFTGSSATTSATTGGTPAGTISALTTGADSSTTGGVAKAIAQTPTFTGSALATHTHTLTATGTNGTAAFTPAGTVAWPAGVPTLSGSAGTVPAETFTGSALGTHSHTLTPSGTNSAPTFTGNSFDPHPTYVKVIFCKAN